MAHIHEKIDFTVDVFIVYKNKVLLRMHEKHHRWLVPGGHIELDEDPVEAAIREVKEEVGLDITISSGHMSPPDDFTKPLPAPSYMGRSKVNDTHEHVFMVYFATSNSDCISDSVIDHEKGVEIKWCTKEDLENMDLIPNIKFFALEALRELGE